jgi:uncharacterized membrane protein (DUF373 family)
MTAMVEQWMALETSQWFVKGLKAILSLLMAVILISLLIGVARTAWDLHLFWTEETEVALRRIIIDALIILAVVEVFRTVLAYFTEGRVKVTFIVDTVLVVILTEMISVWFKGGTWEVYGSMALLLITLGLMRIAAIRFSPTRRVGERPEGS